MSPRFWNCFPHLKRILWHKRSIIAIRLRIWNLETQQWRYAVLNFGRRNIRMLNFVPCPADLFQSRELENQFVSLRLRQHCMMTDHLQIHVGWVEAETWNILAPSHRGARCGRATRRDRAARRQAARAPARIIDANWTQRHLAAPAAAPRAAAAGVPYLWSCNHRYYS